MSIAFWANFEFYTLKKVRYTFHMENYFIGTIIKEYRTRLKISQEELCFGLCAVSTLSRIESGAQVPGRKLVEALFSKMGMNKSVPVTKVDFQRENIEYKVNALVANGDFKIFDLLEEYKNCGDGLDTLETQFYLFFKTMAEDFFNHDGKKALRKYEEALKLSIKDYELHSLPHARLLTKTELLILNNISRTFYFIGEKEMAIELMEFLRAYFEKGIMSEEEKAKNYPVILFNLENWYGLRGESGDYEKTLTYCDIALDCCIRYGKLVLFPFHLFNKGCMLVKLGAISDGKECFEDSFTILNRMKKFEDITYGKKWLKENLGIDM